MVTSWRPGADHAALVARAELLSTARHFFAQRKVLEVETPLLCQGAPTDPHLSSIAVASHADHEKDRYLQTSPEFAMKRLLAAGSGSIYQICKAFRGGESSSRHNPEFTMLEWYRVGFGFDELIAETLELFKAVLGDISVTHVSYVELFTQHFNTNPHSIADAELAELGAKYAGRALERMSRADWLDLLASQVIDPALPAGIVVVTDFPACQAALSEVDENEHGDEVAKRFEIYVDQMELANGYLELQSSAELAKRFASDQQRRAELGLPASLGDDRLLAAMVEGLPQCAGVAVGFDRLLMVKTGIKDIDRMLSFSFEHA